MLADMTGLNALIEGDIQALMNHATLNTDANMFKVLASVSNMDGKLDSLLSEAEKAMELQRATLSVAQVLLLSQAWNLTSLMLLRTLTSMRR